MMLTSRGLADAPGTIGGVGDGAAASHAAATTTTIAASDHQDEGGAQRSPGTRHGAKSMTR